MLPIADGGDLGGSLRNPASFCNVVGLRPSPGRVPIWPSHLGWSSLSAEGPLARTVADVAYVLSVIAGPDSRSPISIDEPGGRFAAPLDRNFKGTRVAWWKDLGGVPVEPAVKEVVNTQRRVFESVASSRKPNRISRARTKCSRFFATGSVMLGLWGMREEMLPRKPLPKPQPAEKREGAAPTSTQ